MDQTETGRPDAAELAAMLRSLRAPDRLNLRQVEAFMAIAAAGSITAAAALLNVSQPGLSRLLMQLERRLGFPLFLRQGKRLTITPEGLDFREEVARSLAGMGHLERVAGDIRQFRRGVLRIAAIPALCFEVLPRAIAGFAARHEALELQFEGQNAQRVMENVLAGHVDVGITQVLGPAPGIGLIAAFRTDCVCVMPKGHALAGEAVVGPKALAAHPLVALPGHSPAGLSLARILAEAGIEVVPRVKTFLSSAACALVAEGVGIAVVDAFTAEFFAGRLEVRPFLPAVDFGFQAIRPALQAPSRAAQAFSAHLLDALAVDPRIRPG